MVAESSPESSNSDEPPPRKLSKLEEFEKRKKEAEEKQAEGLSELEIKLENEMAGVKSFQDIIEILEKQDEIEIIGRYERDRSLKKYNTKDLINTVRYFETYINHIKDDPYNSAKDLIDQFGLHNVKIKPSFLQSALNKLAEIIIL